MNASWRPLVATFLLTSCGAVFPEISPPFKAIPSGRDVAPPPPPDVLFVAFANAEIPPRTRDGRQWDSMGGSLPDPFAILFVNDHEIIRTPIQSNTLKPTWPDQTLANYRIPNGSRVRIEVWDSNTINNHPICLQDVHDIQEAAGSEPMDVECESGAHVRLRVEPAHARWGLGFYYELRTESVAVTRVLAESPAARAGIKAGDEILEIQQKKVAGMEEGEPQSLINANAQVGIDMMLKGQGDARDVKVKEGVVYPLSDEGVPIE